ncbi:MAG: DUF983 domain-containing protein [Alphaproteobacteria bacterium]
MTEAVSIKNVLFSRCPRCGNGSLFEGFLKVKPSCDECGLDFTKADSGDGAAVLLIFLVGFLTVPPMVILALHVDWPLWVHAILASVVILGLALGAMRPAKALMIALQYRHRRETF